MSNIEHRHRRVRRSGDSRLAARMARAEAEAEAEARRPSDARLVTSTQSPTRAYGFSETATATGKGPDSDTGHPNPWSPSQPARTHPGCQMEVMDQREQLQLQRCPCGCPGAPGLGVPSHDLEPSHKIKTKEIVVRKTEHPQDVVDRIFTFEVLRYQGRHHCAEEISPLWKKDCRMWLWKGSELLKEKEKRADKP